MEKTSTEYNKTIKYIKKNNQKTLKTKVFFPLFKIHLNSFNSFNSIQMSQCTRNQNDHCQTTQKEGECCNTNTKEMCCKKKMCGTEHCCKKRCKAFKKLMNCFDVAHIGSKAPYFKAPCYLPSGEIKELSLDDFKGKYLLLLFYPSDWTFVCPTEMIGFSELSSQLKQCNCEILGVSVDSVFCHKVWCETERSCGGVGKLHFPLLSDIQKCISIQYGMLNCETGQSRRGHVIIDTKGMIRHVEMIDNSVGRSTEEAIRTIKALQFTDEHGNVCPLNWKPGKETIKPTPDGVRQYLASH